MKSLPKLLSIFLALLMLLSVFTAAPISAFAADETEQSTAVEETKTAKAVDSVVKTAEDETDESDPSDSSESDPTDESDPDETLPAGDMAAPKSMTVEKIDLYEDLDSQYVKSYDDYENEHAWASYEYADQIECKVTLEDDTVLTSDEDGIITYNGVEFTVDYMDDQSWETPWSTGNHEVTYSILGLETTAVVNVQESPISKVEFDDITCVEGTNGYIGSYYSWDDETEQSVFDKVYFYYNDEPEFTVYLKNGETIQSDSGSVELFDERYSAVVNTKQYDEPWQIGTRKVYATLFAKQYEFDYTITESAVKSISAKDITVYDGVDSGIATYTMDGEEYSYKSFDYNPEITITLKNGTTLEKTVEDESVTVGGVTYRISYTDDQDDDNEWGAGVHKSYVFVGAKSCEINVTVVENPIAELEIKDVEVHAGIDCVSSYDWDCREDFDEYYYTPEFTVTLKNGTTVKGEDGTVKIDGRWYKLNYEDNQSYENQWLPGNKYTVTGSVGSVKDDFKVKVKADTVKSIGFKNDEITVRQGVDTVWVDDGDYEKFDYEKFAELEITMYDDTVVTADEYGDYTFRGKELPVVFSDDQTEENVWGLGVHTASVSVWGVSASFNVTVVGTPAESVEINDVSIIVDTHKHAGKYYYSPTFTITLKNGTKCESTQYSSVYYDNNWLYLDVSDDQEENPWGLGKHTVKGTIMGVTDEFTVEIIESPVKSVTAEPVTLIEDADGYLDDYYDPITDEFVGSYFRYDSYPYSYTLTFKDDTVLTSDEYGCVLYDGELYEVTGIVDNQSYDSQWTIGNTYTCSGSVLGCSFSYEATVTGTPVKSVEVADVTLIDGYDSRTEYDDDDNEWTYYECYSELNVKVTLKNGTVLEGDDGWVQYDGQTYYLTNFSSNQGFGNEWTVGNTYDYTASIMGYPVKIKTHIVDDPVASVKANDLEITELDRDHGNYCSYYENGRYVGDYFNYDGLEPTSFTVTTTDGATVKCSDGVFSFGGRDFSVTYDDYRTNQSYYNQWKAGNTYEINGTLITCAVDYNVKIISKDAPPKETTMTLTAQKSKIYVGDKTKVIANVTNPVGDTVFTSNNEKVATVSAEGVVTAKKVGKVTITAANNGVSKSVTITIVKRANTAKIKTAKKTVKLSALKKKNQTVKAITVKKPQGKVTYTKVKGDKKITDNKKNGKLTLKKGMKRGKYTIKVKIKVKGNAKFKPLTKTVKVTITVK